MQHVRGAGQARPPPAAALDRHRGVQRLHPVPRRARVQQPGDPRARVAVPGAGQHAGRGRARQHGHGGPGGADLLAGRQPGPRRRGGAPGRPEGGGRQRRILRWQLGRRRAVPHALLDRRRAEPEGCRRAASDGQQGGWHRPRGLRAGQRAGIGGHAGAGGERGVRAERRPRPAGRSRRGGRPGGLLRAVAGVRGAQRRAVGAAADGGRAGAGCGAEDRSGAGPADGRLRRAAPVP